MPDRPLMDQLDEAIDKMLAGEPTGSVDSTLSGLMKVSGRLRDLPDDRFKTRLGRELQAPPAIHAITPFICVADGAKLIEFMKHTFGAQETSRNPHGTAGFVAGVSIGDSSLIIMGDESLRGQESPAALHVYVKDCDATYKRALDAGAVTIGSPGVGEPADRPYGERAAFVSDPTGNYWFIATRANANHVTPTLLASSIHVRPLIDFMERAFGARVEGLREEAGRMVHAFIRIGEAVVEMGESQEERLRPFGFYMDTDDVDALYHRALAAGASSIVPPADQLYGDRLAIVADPAGNRWFASKRIAKHEH